MTSKHLVDPELRASLDEMPNAALSMETIANIRSELKQMVAALVALRPENVDVTEVFIAGAPGQARLRLVVYAPKSRQKSVPGVLHIHGGGFVAGVPEIADMSNIRMALDLNCVVVSVDYRLAPETVFPGAVEDCFAGLSWLHAQAETLGVDPKRLAVVGESAGGGLAAGLALMARDRNGPALAFQLLIYPMLDDRTCVRAPHPYAGEFMWTPTMNAFGWKCLLGEQPGGGSVSPYAAPARAGDLAGLPPTFISVGALDLFVEENLEFARRLMRAGVPTEFHIYPGAYHGFQRVPTAKISQAADSDRAAALRRHLIDL